MSVRVMAVLQNEVFQMYSYQQKRSSPNMQLLRKTEVRFVTCRMHANAQKTLRTSVEAMEMDGPRLPSLLSRLKTSYRLSRGGALFLAS
jgi:hypothetical protein